MPATRSAADAVLANDSNVAVVTEFEKQSVLWKKITAHLERRLGVQREKNDNAKSHDATMKIRGRIAEIKNLLALDKPAPAVEADDS